MNYPSHFVLVPVPEGSTSFTQLTNPGLKSDPTQDRGAIIQITHHVKF